MTNAILKLKEWNWVSTKYVAGTTYTIIPGPKSVSKSVDVQWRVAHRGRRKLKKAKFRVRETITWTAQGSCQGSVYAGATDQLREQIEFLSKRNSKFEVVLDADTPAIFLTPDPTGGNARTWEIVFVTIKNVKFSQTEGKIGWFDYTIELERVNCEDLDTHTPSITDPWTCAHS